MTDDTKTEKRGYDLRKRLQNMDQNRLAVLQAAREQLEAKGYRQLTMASLASGSGVTRQTIHNLFGSKQGVLEALFDAMALEGGMERMREVMHQSDPKEMLRAFVYVFCDFWKNHRLLFRRIHGIGAIDPELGAILDARNQRRYAIVQRITKGLSKGRDSHEHVAALTALTSFEFYDAVAQYEPSGSKVDQIIFELACARLTGSDDRSS